MLINLKLSVIKQVLHMKMREEAVAVFPVALCSWPGYQCGAADSVVDFNVMKHILCQENIFGILATSPQ